MVVLVLGGGLVTAHRVQAPRNAALLKDRAKTMIAEGRIDDAVRALRLALAMAPNDNDIFAQLALALAQQNTLDADLEARSKLLQVVRRQPGAAAPRAALLEVSLRNADFPEALAQARALEKGTVDDPRLWLAIGDAHRASHDLKGARNAYAKALERDPRLLDAYPRLVDVIVQSEGRSPEAKAVVDRLLAHLPNAPESYLQAYVCKRDHGFEGADPLLDEALKRFPQNVEVLLMAAGRELERRPLEARRLLEQARSLAPTNPRVALVLGKLQTEMAQPEAALATFRSAYDKLDPPDPEFAGRIAEVLIESNRAPEAAPYLAVLLQHPLYLPLHAYLSGRMALLAGNVEGALRAFSAAESHLASPSFRYVPQAFRQELIYRIELGKAGARFQAGQGELAIAAAERAHLALPGEPVPFMTLGGFYLEDHRYAEAKASFLKASKSPRVMPQVAFELARAELYEVYERPQARRDFGDFLILLDRAKRRLPDLPDLVILESDYQLAKGDLAEALRRLRAGVQGQPNQPALGLSLFRLLLAAQRWDEASRWAAQLEQRFGRSVPLTASRIALALHQGNVDEAALILQQAGAALPAAARPALLLPQGVVAWWQGKIEEAERLLTQATFETGDEWAAATLVSLLLDEGRSQRAHELAGRLRRELPIRPELYHWTAARVLAHRSQARPPLALPSLRDHLVELRKVRPEWWGTLEIAAHVVHLEGGREGFEPLRLAVLRGPALVDTLEQLLRLGKASGHMADTLEAIERGWRERLPLPGDPWLRRKLPGTLGAGRPYLTDVKSLGSRLAPSVGARLAFADALQQAGADTDAEKILDVVALETSAPHAWVALARFERRRGVPFTTFADRQGGAMGRLPPLLRGQCALVYDEDERAAEALAEATQAQLLEPDAQWLTAFFQPRSGLARDQALSRIRRQFPQARWLPKGP